MQNDDEMIDLDKIAKLAAQMVTESEVWMESNYTGNTQDRVTVHTAFATAEFHNVASSLLSEFRNPTCSHGTFDPLKLAEQVFGMAFDSAEICLNELRIQAHLKKIEKN